MLGNRSLLLLATVAFLAWPRPAPAPTTNESSALVPFHYHFMAEGKLFSLSLVRRVFPEDVFALPHHEPFVGFPEFIWIDPRRPWTFNTGYHAFRDAVIAEKEKEAARLTAIAVQTLKEIYAPLGILDEGVKDGIREDVLSVGEGRSPFLLITPWDEPENVLQMFTVAYDHGEGLPWQRRLAKAKLYEYKRPDYRVETSYTRVLDPLEPFREDKELTALWSARATIAGEHAELKNYVRSRKFRFHWGPFVAHILTAQGLVRWSLAPVPDALRVKPEGRELDAAVATYVKRFEGTPLHQSVTDLVEAYTSSAFQNRVQISDLYLQAIGDSVGALYPKFQIKEVVFSGKQDPDVPGKGFKIFRISRSDFERVTLDSLEGAPGYDLMKEVKLLPSLSSVFGTVCLGTLIQTTEANTLYFDGLREKWLKGEQVRFPRMRLPETRTTP